MSVTMSASTWVVSEFEQYQQPAISLVWSKSQGFVGVLLQHLGFRSFAEEEYAFLDHAGFLVFLDLAVLFHEPQNNSHV